MPISTKSLILLVSLPVTVCAAILYYLHKKDEDWDDEVDVLSNKHRIVEIKVPVDKVASLIGRAGINIKKLQDQTDTKINFKDTVEGGENDEYRVCKIRGIAGNTEKAEKLLKDLIYNQPEILTTDIWIPQSACGRLIGRCGENIKAISSQSNAHIFVDTYNHNRSNVSESKGKPHERQVVIKGTAQEIAVALALVKKAVEEDRSTRSTLNSRQPRVQSHSDSAKNKNDLGGSGGGDTAGAGDAPIQRQVTLPEAERLASSAGSAATSDGMIQVYVSSVAHPHAFWVQLVSPRSVELDHLVEDMTEYYNKQENKSLHRLEQVKVGQIVAAPFETDNRWYRVEVYGVEDKRAHDGSPMIDILYLDYGDSGYIPLSQVLELRTDFLSLRFQAIECRLADIEKKEGEKEWSEEAISEFEQLVYSAQWKRIMVTITGYNQHRIKPGIPTVKLFDPATGIDVAEELIKRGLAKAPASEKSSSHAKPTFLPVPNPGITQPVQPTATLDFTTSFIQSESKSNKPCKPPVSSDSVTDLINSESDLRQSVSSPSRSSGSSVDLIGSEFNSGLPASSLVKPSVTSSSSPEKSVSPGKPSVLATSRSFDSVSKSNMQVSPSKSSDALNSLFNSASKYISPTSTPDKPCPSDLTVNLLESETYSRGSLPVKPSLQKDNKSSFIEQGSLSDKSVASLSDGPTETLSTFLDSERNIHVQ